MKKKIVNGFFYHFTVSWFIFFISCSTKFINNKYPNTCDTTNMITVPSGYFIMGDNYYKNDNENPPRSVFIDSFLIDKTEVTNIEYGKCVKAKFCSLPIDTLAWFKVYEGKEFEKRYGDFPISYITWSQARMYCEWKLKRLPSEAEWEKAARGTDGRNYPWGNESPEIIIKPYLKAQYAFTVIDTELNDFGKPIISVGVNSTGIMKIGLHPLGVSTYGVEDMAGNLWEWVSDTISSNTLKSYEYLDTSYRIIKGGGYLNKAFALQSFIKHYNKASKAESTIGFRCVCNTK